MALEETICPLTSSGGSTWTVNPCRSPISLSSIAVPRAPRPKVWLKPTTTSCAPSARRSTSSTNASASIRDSSSVNGMTSVASGPCAAMRARFSSRDASGAGARSGRNTAAGFGSNVHTSDVTPSPRARSTAVSRILACARWMPSKAPSATTEGDRSDGKDGRPRMIRMEQTFGLDGGAAGATDTEKGPIGVIDAHGAGGRGRHCHGLPMAEGAAPGRVELYPRERWQG